MAPRSEGSHLKRARVSGSPAGAERERESFKKPRRSERLSQRADPGGLKTPVLVNHNLPSPVTHLTSETTTGYSKETTATPPEGRLSQITRRRGDDSYSQGFTLSSPPHDTQAFSQQDIDPNAPLSDEVKDEVKEGVWGYLFPVNTTRFGVAPIVLRKRGACPSPGPSEEQDEKSNTPSSGGYLIGRHPECDLRIDDPAISNRHCLFFTENGAKDTIAVLEDLSSNGTYVNDKYVGRNGRWELNEQDEISILDNARFIFRYPRNRHTNAFLQQYTAVQKLGSGHFADVFMCIEKSTGDRYAVKRFTKHPGVEERSKNEGLQQEIAMLMGVGHPNILCLKETFNEPDAVYLVLELAPEGELFGYIIRNQKLSEAECRKLFAQLFDGVKYLHDRNIVHRDIKPENILLMDEDLHAKIADFGLAKIIGEESFTTTLCGTPSYVAPEILADSKHRKYTKAVDIWSLGVVLYICLCGFPPFSDELKRDDFPYSLADQIRKGIFDYPSPYWDPVGDPALDLIDCMLVVDPEKRYTIDQCLAHPWLTQQGPGVNDSTNGLVSGVAGLAMNRRGPARERTLISDINTVHIANRIRAGRNRPEVKVFSKNPHNHKSAAPRKEMRPDDNRDPGEFMAMGGKGDQELFDPPGSSYPPGPSSPRAPLSAKKDVAEKPSPSAQAKPKGKAKGKGKGTGR